SEKKLPARAAEDQRLARLNEHPIEEEFGAQAGQHGLDQVVLAGRNSAGEKQQIRLQPAFDCAARGFILVFRDRKTTGFAARPRLGAGQAMGPPLSARVTGSTMTAASAPSGTGRPVIISTVSPEWTSPENTSPARTSPMRSS